MARRSARTHGGPCDGHQPDHHARTGCRAARDDAGGRLPRPGGLPARDAPGARRAARVRSLVRVEAVGICASDLKCYHGAAKFWGDENRPAWAETDAVPGHEVAGRVVELDDEARAHWGIEVDDRVVVEQIVPCWNCRYCDTGNYHMCAGAQHVRLQARQPRRHGGVHGAPHRLPGPHDQQGHPAGARGLRRTAVLRAARGGAGPDHLRRRRGRRRLRPHRPGHDRRGRRQVPRRDRGPRHGPAQAGAGAQDAARRWRSTSPRRTPSPGSRR